MCDNINMSSGQVRISVNEVGAENACEELRRGDGMLLCLDIDSILHRVCRNNHAVVCLGVSVQIVNFVVLRQKKEHTRPQ